MSDKLEGEDFDCEVVFTFRECPWLLWKQEHKTYELEAVLGMPILILTCLQMRLLQDHYDPLRYRKLFPPLTLMRYLSLILNPNRSQADAIMYIE